MPLEVCKLPRSKRRKKFIPLQTKVFVQVKICIIMDIKFMLSAQFKVV